MAWAVGGGEPLEHRGDPLAMIPYPQAHPSLSFSEEFQLPLQAWGQAGPVGSRCCAPLPGPSHRALPPLTGSQPPFPQPSSQEASSPAAARLPSPFRASSCSLTAGSEQDTRWPCWPTHRPVVQMSLTSDSEHPSQLWAGCCCSQAPPGTRSPCLLVSPTVRCQPLPFTSP